MYNSKFYHPNPGYNRYYYNNYNPYGKNNDRTYGFAVPFILGGLTGGLLAPAFNPRPYYRPIMQPYPYFYQTNNYPIYY